MYIEVEQDTLAILSYESRVERVHIADNLRHDTLEPLFNEETLAAGKLDYPYANELTLLWHLVQKMEAGRGKSENNTQLDFNFHIVDDRVSITTRRRGSPIDKVVSELMILVNCEWGKHLAEHGFPGIYRTQQGGKVRMSTVAAPHQGLGVAQYMWSSSPLRRYVDMVNQRQIIAMLRDDEAPYPKNDTALYATLRDFDTMYTIYNEFQRNMERYWCLRWLQQEMTDAPLQITATVIRENLVRMSEIPLVFRVPSLPEQLAAGTRVQLEVVKIDLLDLSLLTRYVATLEGATVLTEDIDSAEEFLIAEEPVTAPEPVAESVSPAVATIEEPAC
jgi:exoribonuclease-2